MHQFEKLEIWKDSVDLVTEIYSITKAFPKDEVFGMTNQMRRSAISIPANIAEGSCRNNPGEFKHFLGIAAGSTAELITHLHIARKLNLLGEDKTEEIINKLTSIQNRNFALQRKLETNKKANESGKG